MESLVGGLIIAIGFSSAIAYLPLQVYTGISWRGMWRIMALVPILLMVPVFGFTAHAFAQESNLWPLLLIFAAPVGTGYLVVLMVIRRLVTPPPKVESVPSNKSSTGPVETPGSPIPPCQFARSDYDLRTNGGCSSGG
jgi:hypothetical protein